MIYSFMMSPIRSRPSLSAIILTAISVQTLNWTMIWPILVTLLKDWIALTYRWPAILVQKVLNLCPQQIARMATHC